MTDPFLYDDAAYVLGALEPAEAAAFEAHLGTCAECRARVADLRGPVAALASIRGDLAAESRAGTQPAAGPADDAVPDTLLPGLLRRAARERRRRRTLTGLVGTVAAACVLALAIVLWPVTDGPARPPAQAMSALKPIPLTVTARLTAKAWGTRIELHCSYPSYEHEKFAYDLVVIDRTNRAHVAGDWTLVPGKNGIEFTTGTAVPRDQIRQLQVRTPSGTPLLELRPS